jgi:hypothetical protein
MNEDSYNWLLSDGGPLPLVIFKRWKTVPFEVFYHCVKVAKLDGFIVAPEE